MKDRYCEKEKVIYFHMLIDGRLRQDLAEIDFILSSSGLKKAAQIVNLFCYTNRDFIPIIGNERSRKFYVPHSKEVHLKLPLRVYRWIKDSHAGQNVHGMAQIIRAILRYYVELVRKYGLKCGVDIFTGKDRYRIMRSLVRLKQSIFAGLQSRLEIQIQLDELSCLAYSFIREFVVLME